MAAQQENQFYEGLRQNNKSRFEDAARYWNALANDREAELSRSILTVCTVILPLTFFIFNSEQVLQSLSLIEKILIIFMWIILIASIYFGAKHTETESNYFASWGRVESKKAKLYSDVILPDSKTAASDYTKMAKEVVKVQDPEIRSNQINFHIQKILAFVAMGILLLLACLILLQTNSHMINKEKVNFHTQNHHYLR